MSEHRVIPNHQKAFIVSALVVNLPSGEVEVHWALRPIVAWSQETDVNGDLVMFPIAGAVPPTSRGYVELCYLSGNAIVNANGTLHDGDTHWIGIEHYLMSCTGRADPIGVVFLPNISQSRFLEMIK